MKIFKTRTPLTAYISELKSEGKTIGFVPTMGALHAGHLSLLVAAKKQSDVVICSIFINPTQFNDPKDLEKYPRPINDDVEKLKSIGCDILFLPEVPEMYGKNEKWNIELGNLDTIMEGKIRPGHYQGVTQIVKKLFDIIKPDIVFFGQKDYQQIMVIKKLISKYRIPVKLEICPIIRESDGLAMSSRNIYLSDDERKEALNLANALNLAKLSFNETPLNDLLDYTINFLKQTNLEFEYFELRNGKDLSEIKSKRAKHIIALVAAKAGNTRLIDNVILK